jgi:outer membrane murein-binding lipoprotein Lpp
VKFSAICFAAVSAALLLAGCSKNIDTQDAVKAGVIKDLAAKVDVQNMDINVAAVAFRGQEADATVSFSPKGAGPGQSITMKYAMERAGDEWKIKGRSLDGHTAPTAAPGGNLPPGHPGPVASGTPLPPGHPSVNSAGGATTIGPGGVPMPPVQPNDAPKK